MEVSYKPSLRSVNPPLLTHADPIIYISSSSAIFIAIYPIPEGGGGGVGGGGGGLWLCNLTLATQSLPSTEPSTQDTGGKDEIRSDDKIALY